MPNYRGKTGSLMISLLPILPRPLTFGDVRLYIFSATFISLDVLVPWLTHYFGGAQAGALFLPMFFFILLAGLLAGWRAGLLVGLFTPLISFGISGMPPLPVLPYTIVECVVFGLTTGLLLEKLHLRPIWSLLAAIALGRLALLVMVTVAFSLNIWQTSPLAYVWSVVAQGWPGAMIQVAVIPLIVRMAENQQRKIYESR